MSAAVLSGQKSKTELKINFHLIKLKLYKQLNIKFLGKISEFGFFAIAGQLLAAFLRCQKCKWQLKSFLNSSNYIETWHTTQSKDTKISK